MFGHVSIEVILECVGRDEYFPIAQVPQGVYESRHQDALGSGVGQADQEVEHYAPPAHVYTAHHAVDPPAEQGDLEDPETYRVAVFEEGFVQNHHVECFVL